MGPYLYFRVLIFTFLASFTQRMSIQSACIQQWFWFKLLAKFDFYLCLRINFHTSSFWVLIFTKLGSFTQIMSIQSHICRHWFRFTMLANFDCNLCLRINFHTLLFWDLILAAGGPYWVLISQKMGPYLKAWGSLLVLETVYLVDM